MSKHPRPLIEVLAPTGDHRGPGRPTTGTPIHVRIDPDDLAAIDRDAARIGTTRAALLREVVAQYARDVTDDET